MGLPGAYLVPAAAPDPLVPCAAALAERHTTLNAAAPSSRVGQGCAGENLLDLATSWRTEMGRGLLHGLAVYHRHRATPSTGKSNGPNVRTASKQT